MASEGFITRPGGKNHLSDIYRPPPDRTDRLQYIRLDKNEGFLSIPEVCIEEMRDLVTPDFLACYPRVFRLYDAIAGYTGFRPDAILTTAGSDGAIRAVYDAFVEPGDDIVNIQPNFAMYDVYTRLYRAHPVDVWYDPDTLRLDTASVIEKISDRTRLVMISNPNSPTGTEISVEDMAVLAESASGHGAGLVIDEAYYPYSPTTCTQLIDRFDNIIILRSFSKAFGLAGVRAGYALAHPRIIELMGKFKPMYEVNSFAVEYSRLLLRHAGLVEESVREANRIKEWFIHRIEAIGLNVVPSRTNFINIVVGRQNTDILIDFFEKNDILIRSGSSFGLLGECIRISVGTQEAMQKASDILMRWYHDQGNA
jgi:histidinol-phosphate aminotransferase